MPVPFLGDATNSGSGSIGYSNDAPTIAGPATSGPSTTGDFIINGSKSGFDYKTILFGGVAIFLVLVLAKKHKGN